MELISPPATFDEQVTDLDIAFSTGPLQTFTIRDSEDILVVSDERLTITIDATRTPPTEVIVVFLSSVAWYSTRVRTVKRPMKPVPPVGN